MLFTTITDSSGDTLTLYPGDAHSPAILCADAKVGVWLTPADMRELAAALVAEAEREDPPTSDPDEYALDAVLDDVYETRLAAAIAAESILYPDCAPDPDGESGIEAAEAIVVLATFLAGE